jgi:hypothetical protein
VVLHVDTPSAICSEDDDPSKCKAFFDDLMLESQPRMETSFEASADRARMAAPSREDVREWKGFMYVIWGDTPDERGEIESSTPPQAVGYVHRLRFDLRRLEVATTEDLDKQSHLAFRAANPKVDLLWLPNYSDTDSTSIRVITWRSLLDHFEYLDSTPVPGGTRPPKL